MQDLLQTSAQGLNYIPSKKMGSTHNLYSVTKKQNKKNQLGHIFFFACPDLYTDTHTLLVSCEEQLTTEMSMLYPEPNRLEGRGKTVAPSRPWCEKDSRGDSWGP